MVVAASWMRWPRVPVSMQLYENQELYEAFRLEVLRTLGEMSAASVAEVLPRVAGQLGLLRQLHEQLLTRYDELLAAEG